MIYATDSLSNSSSKIQGVGISKDRFVRKKKKNTFTYPVTHLYAGRPPHYHRRPLHELFHPTTRKSFLSIWDIPITTTNVVTTSHFGRLVTPAEVESNAQLHKLADIIPFIYFYWILLLLAILLTLTLIIVFIRYCRTFIKNYQSRRGSRTSFYRRRPINTRHNYQPTAKVIPSPVQPSSRTSETPACPSTSLKCLDDQLYRRDSDSISSPQIARHDVFLREPLSTFTSSTPNSSSMLHSRLSARSLDRPSTMEHTYESQRSSMPLIDKPKNDSMIIDIN